MKKSKAPQLKTIETLPKAIICCMESEYEDSHVEIIALLKVVMRRLNSKGRWRNHLRLMCKKL